LVAAMLFEKKERTVPHELSSKGEGGEPEKKPKSEKSKLEKGECRKN
jgi:hypothetical protein